MPKHKKYWAVVDRTAQIIHWRLTDSESVADRDAQHRNDVVQTEEFRVIPVAIVPYEEVEHEDR